MKKILSSVVLFLWIGIYAQNMRVMSFNIRYDNPDDGDNSWQKRKAEVAEFLQYYHPEILGVQEALDSQMKDLKSSLPHYQAIGVGRDDGKTQGEYAAIFYDTQKLKALSSNTFWLSPTPEKPSKGWDAALNRICTYALMEEQSTHQKFWVFNLHFDHVGDEARKQSSYLILEKIKKINTPNYPVILMGDFNLTEETAPLKIMASTLEDSFYHSQIPHYGPKATFTNFKTNQIPKIRIDYIFTKGVKVLSHRHINDRRENLLYYSDHFPVLVELKF